MGRASFDLLSPLVFLPGLIVRAIHTLLPRVCCVKPQMGSESRNSVPDPNSFNLGSPSRHHPAEDARPWISQAQVTRPRGGRQSLVVGAAPGLCLYAGFRGREGTNVINTKKG